MEQDQDTLGQYLRQKRESILLPVQEIAHSTGAKKTLIQALEDDAYDAFIQRSQAQALVKQVAAYLKLNEFDVLRRFELQWKQHSEKKEFPKLSSFPDTKNFRIVPTVFLERKKSAPWLFFNFPTIFRIPKVPRIAKTRVRWPIFFAIILVGLLLLIELPFSKQKPPPPADPRFSEAEKKPMPAAGAHSFPTPAQGDKAEASPQNSLPMQASASKSLASQEKSPSVLKNGKVVGNSDTKRYHLPGMKYFDKIKAYHRVVFQSEKEAINAGYRKARE